MARDGSGAAQKAVSDFVNGTNISETDMNQLIDDIIDMLTQSVSKDGQTVITGPIKFNGKELILDADQDTSITADTDDQIDIRIAGADDFQLVANVLRALAGSQIQTNTINETTSGSGVTIHSVLLKDNEVTATGLKATNLKANDGTTAGSIADSTGVITLLSCVLTTADVNGGTGDNFVIGATTPAAGSFTTLASTGGITGTLQTAAQPNVTSLGTLSYLQVSGNLGVGASAVQKLHTQTSSANNYTRLTSVTSGDVRVEFDLAGRYYNWIETEDATGDLVLAASNVEKIRAGTTKLSISDNTIIGSTSVTPDGTLHVHTASAGTVSANASYDDFIVENSGNAGISILSPDGSNAGIAFGTPSDSVGAALTWDYDLSQFRVSTDKVGSSLILFADNGVTNLTLSGASGSERATFAGDIYFAGTDPTILGNDTDGSLFISSGNATNNGMNLVMFAGSHATQANDLLVKAGSTQVLLYDHSGTNWGFTGDLTVAAGFLNFGASSELTIATGVITATKSFHTVDTESDSASDDLNTINGLSEGDTGWLRAANDARTVVLKNGAGNIQMRSGADFSLDSIDKAVSYIYTNSTVLVAA